MTWQHNEHFSHYNSERQCMTKWCIRSLRKHVKECAHSVHIKQSFKLLRQNITDYVEVSSMWYLEILFLYSSLANGHFSDILKSSPCSEFQSLFFSLGHAGIYVSFLERGKMQKFSTKSLISNLKCHQNSTNFHHKDGLSYHDQAMDIKSTPQISGPSMNITACCNNR